MLRTCDANEQYYAISFFFSLHNIFFLPSFLPSFFVFFLVSCSAIATSFLILIFWYLKYTNTLDTLTIGRNLGVISLSYTLIVTSWSHFHSSAIIESMLFILSSFFFLPLYSSLSLSLSALSPSICVFSLCCRCCITQSNFDSLSLMIRSRIFFPFFSTEFRLLLTPLEI